MTYDKYIIIWVYNYLPVILLRNHAYRKIQAYFSFFIIYRNTKEITLKLGNRIRSVPSQTYLFRHKFILLSFSYFNYRVTSINCDILFHRSSLPLFGKFSVLQLLILLVLIFFWIYFNTCITSHLIIVIKQLKWIGIILAYSSGV